MEEHDLHKQRPSPWQMLSLLRVSQLLCLEATSAAARQ